MKSMSPTDIVVDILKKHGEWMESSELLDKVMKERNVTDRQAYRDIKKAWKKEGKIRKIELPDGAFLYGLLNWPFPKASLKKQAETLTVQDAFLYRCFKKLDEIGNLNDEGHASLAYKRLKRLKNMLPQASKEKLDPLFEGVDTILAKTEGVDFFTTQLAKLKRLESLVEVLIGKVSEVLHES